MPRPSSRAMRSLRLCALMLLVLSILARPMLEQMGGTHEVEHAVLAAVDVGHDHGHDGLDHDHGHGHEQPGQDPTQDPDHTQGVHGLMHQAEGGATAAPGPAWGLALAVPTSVSPPMPEVTAPRIGVPTTPFRPPIA